MWLPAIAFAVAVAAVGGFVALHNRREPPLPIAITVNKYGMLGAPWPSGMMIATLDLKNKGSDLVCIENWASEPPEPTKPSLAALIAAGYRISLIPGKSIQFKIRLPEETSHWKFNLSVRGLSARERAFDGLRRLKWFPDVFRPIAKRALGFLPDHRERWRLESDPIEVTTSTNGLPGTYQLHVAPGAH